MASGPEPARSSSGKAPNQRRTVARRPTMASPRADVHHESAARRMSFAASACCTASSGVPSRSCQREARR